MHKLTKDRYIKKAVKSASSQSLGSPDIDIFSDLQELKEISSSLAAQMDELKNLGGPGQAQIESIKEDMVNRIEEIMSRTKHIPEGSEESVELQAKASHLQEMSSKISKKWKLYSNHYCYCDNELKSLVLYEKINNFSNIHFCAYTRYFCFRIYSRKS